uniref:SH3 domain-containing protein n=1 Tax=Vitis vinifera TaxID=29760 RepID=F6I1Z5_VITVI
MRASLIGSNMLLCMPINELNLQVEAERSYHQTVLATLEKLYDEMIMEKKRNESSSQPITMEKDVCVPTTSKDANSNGFDDHGHANQNGSYFIAKVIHPFDAQADGELGLSVDDYVVVRQVPPASIANPSSNKRNV